MTSTTDTQTTRACPPSAVADQIVCWFEVCEGDLVLHDGKLKQLVRMWPLALPGGHVGIQLLHGGEIRQTHADSNALTAVRRYDSSDSKEGGR